MVISSHRSDRLTGQTSVFVTRCGARRERPTRSMITPLSPSVGTANTSSRGSCGSTQSRKTNFRRSTSFAHLGIGEILAATGGFPVRFSDSQQQGATMRICKGNNFCEYLVFCSITYFGCRHFPMDLEFVLLPAGFSLNSICSPSGTLEAINALMSSMPIWSAGLESTSITGSFLQYLEICECRVHGRRSSGSGG